jgi:hypothetical protein
MFIKARAHKTWDAMYHKCKKPRLSVEEDAKDSATSSKIPKELSPEEETLKMLTR